FFTVPNTHSRLMLQQAAAPLSAWAFLCFPAKRGMARIESARGFITELQDQGYCLLRGHFPSALIEACRDAFWPRLLAYLNSGQEPNRGPHRHFLPMPFESPCFTPQFFFDVDVLRIVHGIMDERVVADQWGCDVPLCGSEYQEPHVD